MRAFLLRGRWALFLLPVLFIFACSKPVAEVAPSPQPVEQSSEQVASPTPRVSPTVISQKGTEVAAKTPELSSPTPPIQKGDNSASPTVVQGYTEEGYPFWGAEDARVVITDFADFL